MNIYIYIYINHVLLFSDRPHASWAQIQSPSDQLSLVVQGDEKGPEEACPRHWMQAWGFEDPQKGDVGYTAGRYSDTAMQGS